MQEDQVSCTIAVDTMGSDKGPSEFVRGLIYAIEDLELGCHIILVGKKRLLERLLAVRPLKKNSASAVVTLHDAPEVIGMDEKPIQALKGKKNASMPQAVELLREGSADAVVSCGNTGALMAAGTLRLRPLEGIERPALATIIPTKKEPCVLIDVGANPESSPKHLVHNAVLGSHYASAALGIKKPRIGLLTIGTEDGKGTTRVNETHKWLKEIDGIIHYTGLIEGFQVFNGDVDVIVCDGFMGNILLKSSEALFSFIGNTIKEELVRNPKRMIGAALSKEAFRDMRTRLSPDQHAGAPLLGIKGNILKSHGSSNYIAIGNALRIARELVAHDMIDGIRADIVTVNTRIENL